MSTTTIDLGNNFIEALKKITGKLEMSAESAFPYAVKYVAAQRRIYLTLAIVGLFLAMSIFALCLGIYLTSEKDYSGDRDMDYGILSVFSGIGIIIGLVMFFDALCDFWLFRCAPEACTADYILGRIN